MKIFSKIALAETGVLVLALGALGMRWSDVRRAREEAETYRAAESAFDAGQHEESVGNYSRYLGWYPDCVPVLRQVAEIHMRQKEYGKAVGACDRLLALPVEDKQYHAYAQNLRGVIEVRKAPRQGSSYKAALKRFRSALEANPQSADAHVNLGTVHVAFGRYADAQKHFEEAAASGQDLSQEGKYERCNGLLRVYLTANKVKEAHALLAEFPVLPKAGQQPKHALALAYALNASAPGLSREARLAYLKLYQGIGEFHLGRSRFAVHNSLGVANALLGDFDSATRFFKAALKARPGDPGILLNLGTAYLMQTQGTELGALILSLEEKALRPYLAAIQSGKLTDSQLYLVYNSVGVIYYHKGDLDKAFRYLDKAVKAQPKRDVAYRNLGVINFFQQNYRAALENYRKSLAINPEQDTVTARVKMMETPPTVRFTRLPKKILVDGRPFIRARIKNRATPELLSKEHMAVLFNDQPVDFVAGGSQLFCHPVKPLPTGKYTCTVRVTDGAGNVGEASCKFAVDRSPPKVLGLVPAEGSTVDDKRPVIRCRIEDLSGVDPESVSVIVTTGGQGGIVIRDGRYRAPITKLGVKRGDLVDPSGLQLMPRSNLVPGPCEVQVRARDTLGHEVDFNWKFTVK